MSRVNLVYITLNRGLIYTYEWSLTIIGKIVQLSSSLAYLSQYASMNEKTDYKLWLYGKAMH